MMTEMCNCESAWHDHEWPEYYDPNLHAHREVPADEGYEAHFVGPICRECATTHMAGYLTPRSKK